MLQETHGAVRLLRLNDPGRRNPLSTDLIAELMAGLEAAGQDAQIRALVLTGEGGAFSAGADLEFLQKVAQLGAEENLEHSRVLMKLFQRVYTFPKPTIAAVNGPAVAGGAGLATACDLVVMSQQAKIGYTEAKIGFVAALVSVILARCVGEKHAKELLLTGRLVSASEAHRMGLVNEVVAADTTVSRALELAQEVAANSPASLALSKELLHTLPGVGLEDGFRFASMANAWIRGTGDLEEGIKAFFEKRPPKFQ